VLPNRINLERFLPEFKIQNSEFKTILFVHWLSKRKGADMIVPIARHLSQILTINYKILVVGDGPYKDEISKEIKENNLEEQIKLIGFVPNKDIVECYKGVDLFILPSMEEGFPLSLLESMAMGIPYVAFDVGSVREMSPETAKRFLVKSGDVEMFAHKVENLLADEKVYADFRKEGLEKVQEYSIDNVVNKFIELFK
jgi:glycosyltransferase involved in cell wall biosynthesis